MKKIFLFIGTIIILSGCGEYDRYKVQIQYNKVKVQYSDDIIRYYDNNIDTIIVKTNKINKLRIDKKQKLTNSSCFCGTTYAHNVKSFNVIGKIHEKQKPKKSFKEHILSFKKYIPTFLYIISFLFVILFYIKSKSSTMKTITKYTVYGIIVILLIKIGIVLVKYLPPYIELLLK